MKRLILFVFCLSLSCAVKSQTRTFEIKVITTKFKSVKGLLKKVSEEGIGIADYQGNYIIYRPQEISRIKIRRKGLTIGRATLEGTIIGGSAGLILLSFANEDDHFGGYLVAAGALTGAGAVIGSTVGVACEIANNRLLMNINEDPVRYKKVYHKLEPYVYQTDYEQLN
jgi:hypothetical protein